ncbi:35255_t:CDS:2, partial [Racocetra persica]
FYNNGNLVMGSQILNDYNNRTYYEVFIFPFKNLKKQHWKASNSISCGISGEMKAYDFNDNEKVMIIDSCGSLTQWDLNTLSFEKQYQLEWNKIWALHPLEKDFYAFNKSLTLFAVCLQVSDCPEVDLFISVYLTENAMHLSQHICKELSKSNREETWIMFEDLIDEKIYNISNGNLWVQELSKQQWVTYLRDQLKDTNKISALPIKWEVINNGRVIHAQKFDSTTNEWKSLKWEIYPNHLIDEKPPKKFVYRCNLLYNEDLIIITSIGLLILSVWQKDEIRLRYYKGYPFKYSFLIKKDLKNQMVSGYSSFSRKESEYKKKQFFAKKSYIQKLLEEIHHYKEFSLPPPDFDAITLYHEDLCMDKRYPFRELIDDYIDDKITMMLYGHDLLKSFFKNKDHQMMEKLYTKCIEINTEKDNFLANYKLLEIVTFSINDLSVKSPDLLNQFLSHTSFTLSSMEKEIAIGRFSKSHLQNHKTYLQLSNSYFTTKFVTYLQNIKELFIAYLEEKNYIKRPEENPTLILIFPLPKFNSYTRKYNPWKELLFPNPSPFFAESVFSFLVILGFIVFAFAHSLHILLRPTTSVSLSQPSNSDDPNDPWNLVNTYYSVLEDGTLSKNFTLTELPDTSTNMFTMLYTALLAVYIMLTGDATYLSYWTLTEDLTLALLI